MELNKILAPIAPVTPDVELTESVLHVEHKLEVNDGKALWAIISDFNIQETCRIAMLVADAFDKLGHKTQCEVIKTLVRQVK